MPLIGVTSYTPAGYDDRSYALPCEYVRSLRAAGADIVILAEGAPHKLLLRLDGLVLAGGGDIDPAVYDAVPHPTNYMVDPLRDRFEVDLTRCALSLQMPVLAICRGMQILNVALGGDLVAHVPERWGELVPHRSPPRIPVPHDVEVSPASRLAGIIGGGRLSVVSWHHQALDRLGDGLRIVARSEDGVPEAVETESAAWVFGVQWHPELDAETSPRQAALFQAAVGAAQAYSRSRT